MIEIKCTDGVFHHSIVSINGIEVPVLKFEVVGDKDGVKATVTIPAACIDIETADYVCEKAEDAF